MKEDRSPSSPTTHSRASRENIGRSPDRDLPDGWTVTCLGDGLLVDVQPGFACGKHNRAGKGIGHLRPMNVSVDGNIDLSNLKFVPASEAERFVRAGDVIFNNTNSDELVGKTACYTLGDALAFSNHMTRLRCDTAVLEPRFCAMQLHQRWREGYFEALCNHHVSQASVGRKALLETEFLLPPLPEQKRIVTKFRSSRSSSSEPQEMTCPSSRQQPRRRTSTSAFYRR